MTNESIAALGFVTFALLLISIYANKHRSEDSQAYQKKHQNSAHRA